MPAVSLGDDERSRRRGDDGRDLLLISDLHLGAGEAGLAETFRHDAALVNLLARLTPDAARLRLVILGDFVDFLQAAGAASAPDVPDDVAVGRLDRIIAAHQAVADALRGFVAGGGRLTIVPGNHDVELLRLAVRRRLRDRLLGEAVERSVAARLEIVPWFVHVPGVLYAEHGSQYHDLNAFRMLLAPWWTGAAVEHPVGSLACAHGLAVHGRHGARRWVRHAAFVAPAARLAARHVPATRRHDLARYRTDVLRLEAAAGDLGPGTLEAIHRLSEVHPAAVARRLLRLLVRRARAGERARGPEDPPAPATVQECLLNAARSIDRVLADTGDAVPFYIMGHTHRPAVRPLGRDGSPPWFLNPGAWTTGERPATLSGVWVTRDGVRTPVATLQEWDDDAGDVRPLATRPRSNAAA